MSSSSPPKTLASSQRSFESLPGEIRNLIYAHLLSSRYIEADDDTDKETEDDRAPRAKTSLLHPKKLRLYPAILQTNKAINKEATPFFQSENLFVTVHFPSFPIVSRILSSFPTIRYDNIRRFPYAALHFELDITTNPYIVWCIVDDDADAQFYPFPDEINIIMVAHDLPKLVKTIKKMRYAELGGHRTIVKLSLNQAFQNRVDGSKILSSTFGYFLELLRTKQIAIGPEDNATESDLGWDPTHCCGPHLYIMGKELTKMYQDFQLQKLDHKELDSRDEESDSSDE